MAHSVLCPRTPGRFWFRWLGAPLSIVVLSRSKATLEKRTPRSEPGIRNLGFLGAQKVDLPYDVLVPLDPVLDGAPNHHLLVSAESVRVAVPAVLVERL